MKLTEFELMSIDELWALHLEIDVVLTRKISAKTNELDQRLRLLVSGVSEVKIERERRPYPRVLPKYQNPEKSSETWAGRGKQPRWVTAQLRSGKTLQDLQIRSNRLIGKSRTRSRRKSRPALMAA